MGNRIANTAVIGPGVQLGKHVTIGHYAVIHENTRIGDHVTIHEHAVVGKLPMKASNSATTRSPGNLPEAVIGPGSIIGTGSIVYRGAWLGSEVFVADLATVRERVTVGERTIVGRGAAIENDCSIGARCKLETNSYICAFSEIGDDVFIAPYVVTTNDNYLARSKARFGQFKGVTIKRGGRVGAGATILPGRTIFEDGVAAAGSVVVSDVPRRMLVVGVPARVKSEVPKEQWLENQ
ncbi:N-acetyltransferase [Paenibacillus sp. HB172176]|uniref:acyltransferase n=1 Tax=Paenibacillus sp. HB172176 TaxID=2493690 RepID=UPI00143C441A|nr:N-acetyltransferase [Paenibacillus sp. HB172176]